MCEENTDKEEQNTLYTCRRSTCELEVEQFLTGLNFLGRVEGRREQSLKVNWRSRSKVRAVPFVGAFFIRELCPVFHEWERMHMFRINRRARTCFFFYVNAWRSVVPFFHSRKSTISVKHWITTRARLKVLSIFKLYVISSFSSRQIIIGWKRIRHSWNKKYIF